MIALYPKTVRWKVTSTHFGRNMDRWQMVRWSQVKTSRQNMSCGLTFSHVHVHVLNFVVVVVVVVVVVIEKWHFVLITLCLYHSCKTKIVPEACESSL